MALKPQRVVLETDITLTCSSVTERGVGLVRGNAGSGITLGDSAGTATLAANPSGNVFAGLLLSDIVSVDETKFHRNWQKDVQVPGERVNLLKKGRITTNMIIGTPTDGATAYLSSSGNFTPTLHASGGVAATPKVGQFVGIKDENGYQTIDFNFPN